MIMTTNNVICGRMFFFIIVTAFLQKTNCYSSGKVEPACDTRIPGHHASAMTSESPFAIKAAMHHGHVHVQLYSKDMKNYFEGFLVQALDENGNIAGMFQHQNPAFQQLLACSYAHSSVSHNSTLHKRMVNMIWSPGMTDYTGPIKFVATVVKSYDTFWTDISYTIL